MYILYFLVNLFFIVPSMKHIFHRLLYLHSLYHSFIRLFEHVKFTFETHSFLCFLVLEMVICFSVIEFSFGLRIYDRIKIAAHFSIIVAHLFSTTVFDHVFHSPIPFDIDLIQYSTKCILFSFSLDNLFYFKEWNPNYNSMGFGKAQINSCLDFCPETK